MVPKDDSNQLMAKKILDWLTSVGAIASVLASIFGVLLKNEENAKLYAFSLAILLAIISSGVYIYQRRRAAKLNIADALEPLSATAALRGLLPFEEGDQLPGRSRDVQQLYTLVSSSSFRFGVLWGDSGCGKTSLLRAGLVPKLKNEKFLPLYINKPTGDPQDAIRFALLKEIPNLPKQTSKSVKQILISAASKGKKIVIILDQFEEFFITNRTTKSRAGFIKWLGEIIANESVPVVFLIGIRADFFAQLQGFAPQVPEPTSIRTTYQLQNFDTEQAKQIFNAAAKADGIPFEPELVQAVISELESEEFVRPAELQVVGTRLKRKNITRRNQYELLGGARGILSSYISDEIKQSPNDQTARLVLRLMCADTIETKSTTDLSLEDILRGVGGEKTGAHAPDRPQTVQVILDRFVTARILIHTDDDKYNLAHDYLAPYVRTATEGTETNTERANRLLKRYVAEYKEDPKTIIPMRLARWIQKYASADAQRSDNAIELMKKSRRTFFIRAGSILAVPVLLLGVTYIYLANSYYISTDDPSSDASQSYVVIRRGHPQLKFLPGFDSVAVQTDWTENDWSSSSLAMQDMRSEKLTGYWFENTQAGYQKWEDQVTEHLSVIPQARSLRWMGKPDLAQKVLLDAISDAKLKTYERSAAVDALVESAEIEPKGIPANVLQKLADTASDSKTDAGLRSHITTAIVQFTRVNSKLAVPSNFVPRMLDLIADPNADIATQSSAIYSVTQLVQANPQVVTPDLSQKLIHILTTNTDIDASLQTSILDAFAQTVQAPVNSDNQNLVNDLIEVIANSRTDNSVRTSATNFLKNIIKADPKAATTELIQQLSASYGNYWVDSSVADILGQIAQSRPQLITSDLFHRLVQDAVSSQFDTTVRSNLVNAVEQMIPTKSALITADVIQIPISVLTTSYTDSNLRISAQNLVVQLVKANPKALTPESLKHMIEFVTNLQYDSVTRQSVQGTVQTLAKVNPQAVTPELLEYFLRIYTNTSADTYFRDWTGYVLEPLFAANPEAAPLNTSEQLLNMLTDTDVSYFVRSHAGYCLGPLANSDPSIVTEKSLEALLQVILDPAAYDAQDNSHRVQNSAISALEQFSKASPKAITDKLVQELLTIVEDREADPDIMLFAENGIVKLAHANHDLVTSELIQKFVDVITKFDVESTVRINTENSLSELAKISSKAITSGTINDMLELLTHPQLEFERRIIIEDTITELAIANHETITSELMDALWNSAQIDQDKRRDNKDAGFPALGSLAEANPDAVSPKLIDDLEKLMENQQADINDRRTAAYVLAQIIPTDVKMITPEMLEEHSRILADPTADAYLRYAILDNLKKLGEINHDAITSRVMMQLVDFIGNSGADKTQRLNILIGLDQLAKVTPNVVQPIMLLKLENILNESKFNTTLQANIIATLQHMSDYNPQSVNSELLENLIQFISDPKFDILQRSSAVTALQQLATANPSAITSEVLVKLVDLVASPDRASSSAPDLVDSSSLDLMDKTVIAVCEIAQSKPEAVSPELLQQIIDWMADASNEANVRTDLARVLGEIVPSQQRASTVPILLDQLQSDRDSIGRNIAGDALFEIALQDKEQRATIQKSLGDEFFNSPKPHLRIAAMQLTEMMTIGDLVKEVQAHKEEQKDIERRLQSLYINATEPYIRFAALVTLNQLGKVFPEDSSSDDTSTGPGLLITPTPTPVIY